MKYNRILLKLSGEALLGKNSYGIDNDRLVVYAEEIKQIHDQGVEIAIVIGGGNIFRGLTGSEDGIDRVQADYMGMLATVINGLALQNALENMNIPTINVLVAQALTNAKTISKVDIGAANIS